MKKFTFIALLATLLCGCAQFADEELNTQKIVAPESIEASFEEPSSRTYVENDKYLRWTAGDEISYFPGVTFNMEYRFTGVTGANNGSFSKVTVGPVTGNELSRNYAIYPYDEDIAVSDEGVISLNLPAVQKYAVNSFGVGANTMVAATNGINDEVLKFRNVGGYLKIKLYGDDVTVKSVKLQGNNNEKIAGPALITATYGNDPTVVMTAEATTSVTIDCEEGVTISDNSETPTEFWFVLPTVTFEDGFTITVTDINDGTFVKSTSNTFTIDRNMIQPMKELNAVIEGGSSPEPEPEPVVPETWKIYYTATDTVSFSYYADNDFGATVVSNEWNSETGKGIITFDGEVTRIPRALFRYCENLTTIKIPESVTSIGAAAFSVCSSLTSITIPEGVTSIEREAFSGCSSLKSFTLPHSIISIGEGAFLGCANLKTIVFHSNLTSLGNNLFNTPIDVYITDIASWCKIDFKGPISNNATTTLYANGVLLEDLVIPEGVSSISSWAFTDCSTLTSVTIPNSLTDIDWDAFDNSNNIQRVNIPNMRTWCSITFSNVTANPLHTNGKLYINDEIVSNVVIPNSVSEIKAYAFYGCSYITSLSMPSTITSIGNEAFYNCTGIDNITIPEKVVSIGDRAFYNCTGTDNIIISESVVSIGDDAFYHCKGSLTINSKSIVENNYSTQDDSPIGTWLNGTYFTHLIIGNDITKLGNLVFNNTYFTDITLPNNLTSIGEHAFANCQNFTSITLPSTISSIGGFSFASCKKLTAVYCKAVNPPATPLDQWFEAWVAFTDNPSNRIIYVPASDDDSIINAYKTADYWKEYADAFEEYEFE